MPVYDYKCPTCDERFEVRQSIADCDKPTSCPQGHEGAVRVITSWGTAGAIRSGTPGRGNKRPVGNSLESQAKAIAHHKRHGG